MSIAVDLSALEAEALRFGTNPLLVTNSIDGPPHVSSVVVVFDGDDLVMRAGRKTRSSVAERPDVTLVWMSEADPDYCLIVDAAGRTADETLVARPTSAVLHRLAEVEAEADNAPLS